VCSLAAPLAWHQDPYEALLLATREDRACPVDVGLLNGKPFMNSASIGASADIGKTTSSSIKKVLGPAAFLFTGGGQGVQDGKSDHKCSVCASSLVVWVTFKT
jgi:diacylglycerol kinase family enzyme